MKFNRRGFIGGCSVGLASSTVRLAGRQGDSRVYPGLMYRAYHRCHHEFLANLAGEALELRKKRLARLTDRNAVEANRQWVRKTFWELVGGAPERTPLNARTAGSFEREGYRVENVVYESFPGMHVPANLYMPTRQKPPFPGVLFQMGHSLNGKANGAYQRCCQGLAQLGFLVLAFDPMGQGERTYYPDKDGYLTRLGSADDEHTHPGKQMILLGDTSTRMQVWDAVRSLDYLAQHPMVDPKRLASTGQSGGATLTMLLAAVDERLSAAVVSCGNTENFVCADFNPPGSTDDAEQNLIRGGAVGFDRWDLLYPMAPNPLLVLVSARDWFGTYSPRYLSSGWTEFLELKRVYEILGQPDHLAWGDSPLPHNLAYDFRVAVYNWFLKYLGDDPRQVSEEPPTRVEPDEMLWATKTGNVVRDLGSVTPFSMNRAAMSRQKPGRIAAPALRRNLRIPDANPTSPLVRLGVARSGDVHIEALEVASEESIWIPAWYFAPRPPRRAERLLVVIEPAGRSQRWREDDLYQQLAQAGIAVLAPDIRWIGDLRPEYSPGARTNASFHQEEEAWAWASLMLDRPLLGQRTLDLLAVCAGLRRYEPTRNLPLTLAARGDLSVPALCAGALCSDVETVLLSGGPISFRSIVETEMYKQPLANLLFGVLRETDLPWIAELMEDRRLIVEGMVDGAGNVLAESDVREHFRSVRNLTVRAEAAWNLAGLGRI